MISRSQRLMRLAALLFAFTLIAASCGDDGDADEADAGAPATEAPADDAAGDEPSDDMADDADDDGSDDAAAGDMADDSTEDMGGMGDMADDSLPAVKVGLIAQDEELLAFPEVRSASQAFVDYFNAELGGADGHPIDLVVCGAGDAPESHVACAQEFINADDIHLVVAAGFLANSAAAASLLAEAGVPTLTLGNDFVDYLMPGVYTLDPGLPGLAQVFFVYATSVRGDVSATLFIADDPAFEPFVPALQAIAESNGMIINEVVPLGFEPDLTGPVSAANLDNDAWLFVLADGAQCGASAAAVDTVGYTGSTYANDLCMAQGVIESGALDGWAGPVVSAAPTVDGGEEVDLIVRVLDTYGDDDSQTAGLTGWALANMYAARDVLTSAGLADATRASVLEALSTYSSTEIPGFPDVSCPGPSVWTGACNQSPLMVVVDNGQLTSPDGFVLLDFSELDFLLGG